MNNSQVTKEDVSKANATALKALFDARFGGGTKEQALAAEKTHKQLKNKLALQQEAKARFGK